MKRVAFLLGFGLLPLWAAIVVVFLGSLLPSRSIEYWNVAPWLIISSIPVCGATLLIAGLTLARQALVSGDRAQKYKAAAKFFWLLIFLTGVIVGALWLRHEERKNDLKMEEGLALDFVKNNMAVIQKVGGNLKVFPASITTTNNGQRVRYIFTASPKDVSVADQNASTVYVVVGVSLSTRSPTFSLECITPPGQRISFNDPCKDKK